MKAKFIQIEKKFEIRLEDGTVYTSNKNENSKAFTKRVTEAAALDQGPLEITELTTDALAKVDVEKLKAAKEKESGLLAELMQKAIDLRTADVMQGKSGPAKSGLSEEAQKNIDAINNKEANKIAADKAKAEAAEKKKAEKEAKDKAKAEAAEKKKTEKEAKKAEKAEIEKPTLESVMTAAAEAKANVGHIVNFCPHRTAMKTAGIINGVWVDKRVPMALYRIFDAEGNMYNKVISAPDLEIGDIAPNPKAEEKAKAKEAKEIAKKEASENKEKEKAEKLVAKEKAAADKLEAAQKKAEEKVEAAKQKAAKALEAAQQKLEEAKKKAETKEANEVATK